MNKRLENYIKNELPKEKDNYKKILMLYSLGVFSGEEIQKYTGIESINEILNAIYKIEKNGEYTDLILEDIIDLYNSGIININEIAEKTGDNIDIVARNIQRAVVLGRIVIKTVPTGNYAKIIELAKQNKNDEQIQEETGLPYTIVSRYLNKATEEGHIEKRNDEICGRLRQITDLILEGKDENYIIKKLIISPTTYYRYYKMALERRLIPKKENKKSKEKISLEEKIFDSFQTYTYTIEVARKLHKEPYIIFDTMENLEDGEKERLLNIRLAKNPLYTVVKKQADIKECKLEDILDEMLPDADYKKLFLIARLYYLLNSYQKSLETFCRILNTKKNDHSVKELVLLERRKMKIDMLRRDFLDKKYTEAQLCTTYGFDKSVIESVIKSREKREDLEL